MSSSKAPLDRARDIQVSIPIAIGIAVVLVAGGVYAFVLKPSMDEAQIKKNWATDAAAANRGPGKQVSPAYEAAVQSAIQKERGQAGAGSTFSRRRRDDE